MEVISSIEQVTPAWIAAILRREGVLDRGEVLGVHEAAQTEMPGGGSYRSGIHHIVVTYSADPPAAAPRELVLKDYADHEGKAEVAFYTLVRSLSRPLAALPRCYDALYDAQTGRSHVLMDDLARTHVTPVTRADVLALRGVPAPAHLDQIVDTLAEFHGYWWEHPLLGKAPDVTEVSPWYRDEHTFAQFVKEARADWATLIAAEQAWFPVDLRRRCEQILERLPSLWERHLAPRIEDLKHLSLATRDGYFNQYLCPRDPTTGRTYRIDFEGISADFGAMDLVFLFATFWPRAVRKEGDREELLLRRYHQALIDHGVRDYTWDTLLTDYKLMITLVIWVAVWDQTYGSGTSYWWPKLQCLLGAYEDLRCDELFDH